MKISIGTSLSWMCSPQASGSNMCRIAVAQPRGGDTAVVMVVEDNLVKGASGQAIQAMNIVFGLDEDTGLKGVALLP